MITVGQALAQSGLVPVDAQVLLAYVVGNTRAWVTAHGDELLTPNDAARFFSLARRRRDGQPIAYLTGVREFWGLSLFVTQNVMIPRPETETLVERALARLAPHRESHVLDLGTGSGAIALALARERPRAQIVATDVSEAALRVAGANAKRLGLYNVSFILADWYEGVEMTPSRSAFDAVVSNPPYIAAGDWHLGQGDLRRIRPSPSGVSAPESRAARPLRSSWTNQVRQSVVCGARGITGSRLRDA